MTQVIQAPRFESVPLPIDEAAPGYRHARMAYFVGAALRHPEVWQTHHDNGQFGEIPVEGMPNPVTARPSVQHCMVEAARARVLGDMLGLNEASVHDLEKAALLHDSYKGQEVRIMRENGPSWESYDFAQAMARLSWEVHGRYSKEVMDIAGSVAHESLQQMEELLAIPAAELTDTQKMMLAMHYLDDYTVEFDWATPAGEDGNDLDRRMAKNENNERYRSLNETGLQYFGYEQDGVYVPETAYQAQRRIGHLVENRLAELVSEANNLPEGSFSPLDMPIIIDNQIKQNLLSIMGAGQPAAA